jgi:hypothetical protein
VIAIVLGAGLVALVVGWVAGMWTRKRSDLWCPVDGTKLTCPRCAATAMHPLAVQPISAIVHPLWRVGVQRDQRRANGERTGGRMRDGYQANAGEERAEGEGQAS